MKFQLATSILTAAMAVAGCDAPGGQSDTTPARASSTAGAADQTSVEAKGNNLDVNADAELNKEAPPPAPTVLYVIYGKDGDGATTYDIGGHSVVSFWVDHSFKLGGRQYYTGFAQETPVKYGDPPRAEDPTEGVNLTAATFELVAPGTEKPWRFLGAEMSIGTIGTMGKNVPFDRSRKVQQYKVDDHRLLLAIPTRSEPGTGSTMLQVALFTFDAPKPGAVDHDHLWQYVGSIEAGSNSAPQCKENANLPCVEWTADVQFEPNGKDWPEIAVIKQGTEIDDMTGDARTLTASDNSHYIYDSAEKKYRHK